MEETTVTIVNQAELCGTMAGSCVFSHAARGEAFYTFPLMTRRLSGASDIVNVVLRQELSQIEPREAEKIRILGELRSFNNKRGDGARLVITVFARQLQFCEGEDENLVRLTGTLCKPPNLRVTPMGRDICDLMLAVNRRYGRSDYLPCITWGLKARQAAGYTVGDRVSLQGRIQSRNYIKLIDGVPLEKTAYEVSVTELSLTQ